MTILFDSTRVANHKRLRSFGSGILKWHPVHTELYTEADRQWAANHFGNAYHEPFPDFFPDECPELDLADYFDPFEDLEPAVPDYDSRHDAFIGHLDGMEG